MRRRSSTTARATPSCSTAPSSTATSATPRRTTSTRCSTDHRFRSDKQKRRPLRPAFFVGRHSGAMRSIELWGALAPLRISRFRVWSFGPSRNDVLLNLDLGSELDHLAGRYAEKRRGAFGVALQESEQRFPPYPHARNVLARNDG